MGNTAQKQMSAGKERTEMEGRALREQIVAAEWSMFQSTHNRGGRAACQDDYATFHKMRMAQFGAWSDEAAASYLEDLTAAGAAGRNLVAEKYLHMMKSTHPAEYEAQKHLLPPISEEKSALANGICEEMLAQTVPLREAFPHVGDTGRPLFSDADRDGFTSVQTYQLGELLTYSEHTLRLLKKHLFALKAEGRSLAREVTANSVCACGFSSLEEADMFCAARQKRQERAAERPASAPACGSGNHENGEEK